MKNVNEKYIIDKEKLSLLRIKLILECSEIVHHEQNGQKLIISDIFLKNLKSSFLLDDKNKIKEEDGKQLHHYEYDEYKKSLLVTEIEKLLNDDLTTINNINEELFLKNELKYYKEVLSCIKKEENNFDKNKIMKREKINEK